MLRLRLGLYGLATLASALIVTATIGHTQSRFDWVPNNLTAVDRGISPVPRRVGDSPSARHRFRAGERRGRSGAAYVPGRVIVKFRNGVTAALRTTTLGRVSRTASLARSSAASGRFDLVNISANEDPEAVAAALSAQSTVEYAQPAYRVYPYAADTFVPNDAYYAQLQWNFPLIDLPRAWAIQPGASSSIIVAVVDTGIAYQSGILTRTAHAFCSTNELLDTCPAGNGTNYPALGTISVPFARASDLATSDSRFVAPADFIWGTTDASGTVQPGATPLDMDGHGTHVASTIGELTNNSLGLAGIAFNARLMPVKVIDSDWDDIFRSPNMATDDVVAAGIYYAADHGANVINLSLGRVGPSNCGTSPLQAGCAPAIESAIRYAVGKGCFVAIAAGNDGSDLLGNEAEVIAEIASRVSGAVSVAAVDRQGRRATYSTIGSYVELSAPGGDGGDYIWQQTYDYDFTDTFMNPVQSYGVPRFDMLAAVGYQGTSMATAHVSGVAALLMAQGIKNPAVVEAALEQLATPCSGTDNVCGSTVVGNRNNNFGFGEINARNTLRGLGLAK